MEFIINQHIGIHPMALAELGKVMAPACSPARPKSQSTWRLPINTWVSLL
jgi:hypothetical protein